jgi:hypothetical protein
MISATVRFPQNPVDGRPGADPFAGHGISPLAQSGDCCPRRMRKPSRRLGQIDDGCAVGLFPRLPLARHPLRLGDLSGVIAAAATSGYLTARSRIEELGNGRGYGWGGSSADARSVTLIDVGPRDKDSIR